MDMTLKIPDTNTNPNIQAPVELLPETIPAGSLASQLAAIYGFDEDDVEVVWRPSQVAIGNGLNSEEEEKFSVCKSSELPIDTTQESFRYLYWLATVRSIAEGRDWAVDALNTSTSTVARRRTSGGSANTKAPATIPPQPVQPLPSPTFVPANTAAAAAIKLDKSLQNAFSFKGKSLSANPPEDECEDGTNPVLVYDMDKDEVVWECREEGSGDGGGCCQLIVLDDRLDGTTGIRTGSLVQSIRDDGSFVFGDSVSVVVPNI